MKTDLIINANPKSMFSESIKSIRTNLAFASIDKDVKSLAQYINKEFWN